MSSSFFTHHLPFCLLAFFLFFPGSHLTHYKTHQSQNPSGRIINGWSVPPGAFPAMVALLMSDEAGTYFDTVCGGVVWNEDTVITAAHCVTNATGVILAPRFRVYAGSPNITELEPAYTFDVNNVIVHTNWSRETGRHDIAILKLSTHILFETTHSRVRCACEPEPSAVLNLTRCAAMGWGRDDPTDPTVYPSWLQYTRLPILPVANCTAIANRQNWTAYDPSRLVCAGRRPETLIGPNSGTCDGDSGGPLFCPLLNHTDVWSLVGVLSHTMGPSWTCADPEGASYYTDIRYYMQTDWFSNAVQVQTLWPTSIKSLFKAGIVILGLVILFLIGGLFLSGPREKITKMKKGDKDAANSSKTSSTGRK